MNEGSQAQGEEMTNKSINYNREKYKTFPQFLTTSPVKEILISFNYLFTIHQNGYDPIILFIYYFLTFSLFFFLLFVLGFYSFFHFPFRLASVYEKKSVSFVKHLNFSSELDKDITL
jgi:hypothetical protein